VQQQAGVPRDGALLSQADCLSGQAARLGQAQNHWRRTSSGSRRGIWGKVERPGDHPRYRLGHRSTRPRFENKRIYVWFEAVIGYLSAARSGRNSAGIRKSGALSGRKRRQALLLHRQRQYHFSHHHLAGDAHGYGGLNLPYDVPPTSSSPSREEAFDEPQLGRLAARLPLPLRPRPAALPAVDQHAETGDTDFSWKEFFRRNNDELVATTATSSTACSPSFTGTSMAARLQPANLMPRGAPPRRGRKHAENDGWAALPVPFQER